MFKTCAGKGRGPGVTQKEPLVSVIVPAFNAEHYIEETLRSIVSQTYEQVEICVVDDGSTDKTATIVARFGSRVRYFRQANSGGCAAPRNTGIAGCSGSYLTFIDADDIMPPERIERQVEFLQKNPEVGIVFCDYRNFGTTGLDESTHFQACPRFSRLLDAREEAIVANACIYLADENFGISGSFMLQRELLSKVAGFDVTLKACEDFHFYYRLARVSPAGVINHVGLLRRLHGSNMSANNFRMLTEKIKCLSKLIPEEKCNEALQYLNQSLALNWSRLGRHYANRRSYLKAISCELNSLKARPSLGALVSSLRNAARVAAIAVRVHSPNDA